MDLGSKLRKHRELMNLSVKEVADRAKVTSSLISQIEHNHANPSLSTLKKIASVLNTPLAFLFTEDENTTPVVRKNQRRKIVIGENNSIVQELLTPNINNQMEVLHMTFEKGISSEGFMTHNGEECGLILEGVLELTLGTDVYILEEGDSVYFPSTIPHSLKNAGDCPLKMVWIITPLTW